jgi:hypothetical protein
LVQTLSEHKRALCRSVWNLTAHPMLCQAR